MWYQYYTMRKVPTHVILSAAKNPQFAFPTRLAPEILRCAQNDRSSQVSHSILLIHDIKDHNFVTEIDHVIIV